MNLRKILMMALIAFVAYYVIRSPNAAASAFRGAGSTTFHGLQSLAESIAKFVDALFS